MWDTFKFRLLAYDFTPPVNTFPIKRRSGVGQNLFVFQEEEKTLAFGVCLRLSHFLLSLKCESLKC